ncbi:MAG: sel1 repeat family protein [Candidatus Protochlamydia sp.]|nr:sel1 repeat family protein [Candidatus Protochlamydia sp.]
MKINETWKILSSSDSYQYFSNPFSDVSRWQANTSKINAIALGKILFCFFIAGGVTYGLYILTDRIKKQVADPDGHWTIKLFAYLGNTKAQYKLARMFEFGEGGIQNEEEAVRNYELAANQGHAEAQYQMGMRYKNGNGVRQNDTQAVYYLQLAADQGNVCAQNNLATINRLQVPIVEALAPYPVQHSSEVENRAPLCPLPYAAAIYPSNENLKFTVNRDKKVLSNYGESIISGYLNLGKDDGWKEGSDPRLGEAFTRYILIKFFLEEKQNLGLNELILVSVINAFSEGAYGQKLHYLNQTGVYPKFSRGCHDYTVSGWIGHAISRIVGKLGSTYDPLKPAFEILVNSARTIKHDPLCRPFHITIYKNEKEIEDHRKLLASLSTIPVEKAYHSFYSLSHKRPGTYLNENKERLGPTSTRILKGLEFLENTTISAQKVGNCWIKQPIRCLLTCIYLESLMARPQLSPEEVWNESKILYKRIQKISAIPYIQDLIESTPLTRTMRESTLRAITLQRNL